MNLFDKQLGHTNQEDLHAWMDQIERHINSCRSRWITASAAGKRLEEGKDGKDV